MKVVILSGGNPPPESLLKEELSDASYLICADSGANCLFNYNVIPDYLIGDFDSIDEEALEYFYKKGCKIERHPKEKDDTDSQLALLKAVELKADNIVFLGCTGSRLDHTLGNINLLFKCFEYNIEGSIRDGNNHAFLSRKSIEIKGKKGDTFSIIPYASNIKGLTIEGAKYELNDYNFNIGDSLTLSNEFINTSVRISFKSGMLLLIKSSD